MTYDVVLGIPQSNMGGAADDYIAADQYNNPRICMWDPIGARILTAYEPQVGPETRGGIGASNTFLKDYAAQFLTSGRKLLMVNMSRGGTGFTLPSTNPAGTGFHWQHGLPDDANNLALRARDALQAALTAAGPGSRLVAVLANHGSTDGTHNTPKETFKGYLTDWINWLRDEFDAPTVPYVMMQMRPDLFIEPRHKAIDDGQQEVAAELDHVFHVPSPNDSAYWRSGDVVHFNALGMRTIGHNLFDAWLTDSAQFTGTWTDTWSDTWGGASAPDEATGTGVLDFAFGIGGVGASDHTGDGALSFAFALGGEGATGKSGVGSLPYDFRISGQAANGQGGTGHLTYTFTIAGEGSAPAVDEATGEGVLGFAFALDGSGTRDPRGTGSLATAWIVDGAGRTDRVGVGSLAWSYTITGSSQSKPFPTIRTLLGTAPTRALNGTAPTRTLEGNRT